MSSASGVRERFTATVVVTAIALQMPSVRMISTGYSKLPRKQITMVAPDTRIVCPAYCIMRSTARREPPPRWISSRYLRAREGGRIYRTDARKRGLAHIAARVPHEQE